jgi:signal transduction histidine kinase
MSATAATAAAPPADQAAGRVLVVDDEPGMRKFVAQALAECGHHADAVGGVDEALGRLGRAGYDVALVDLNMPGRSGLELLEAIGAAHPAVVPILLTGTTDVGAAVAGMKRGAFDYVAKPFDPDTLCWAVGRAVGVARARRRERALERVASEWAATFDACPDMLLIVDPDGRVVRANEAVARATAVGPARLVGMDVETLFPGGLGAAVLDGLRHPAPDPAAAPATTWRGFDAVLGAHFLLSVTAIRTAPDTRAVVVRDVTALVRRKEERRRLLRRVLTAQEDERGRLARELHDGVGQALVSLAVGLADGPAGEPPAANRDRLARLRQVAADSLEEVRRLAHGLRPAVLDDLGLAAALARMTDSFTRVHAVRAELLTPGGPAGRLPTEVESALYRIVQEGLTNVAKHARARTVDVVLEAGDGFVRVSVTDDGVGFDTAAAGPEGFGVAGIKERVELLGGTRGTTLDVRVPIPEEPPCPAPG